MGLIFYWCRLFDRWQQVRMNGPAFITAVDFHRCEGWLRGSKVNAWDLFKDVRLFPKFVPAAARFVVQLRYIYVNRFLLHNANINIIVLQASTEEYTGIILNQEIFCNGLVPYTF